MRRILVDYEFVVIGFILFITVSRKRSDKFSLPAPDIERRTHLDRNIAAIFVVHDIFEGHDYVIYRRRIANAVDLIVYCNKTNAEEREHRFEIFPRLHVISSETGKILHDHAIYFFTRYIREHPLKIRAVEIGSDPSFVDIKNVGNDLGMFD